MSFVVDHFEDINKWTETILGSGMIQNRVVDSFEAVTNVEGDLAGLVSSQSQLISSIRVNTNRGSARTVLLLKAQLDISIDPMPSTPGYYYYAFIRDHNYGLQVYDGYGYNYIGADPVSSTDRSEMRIDVSGGIITFYYNGVQIYSEALRTSDNLHVYVLSYATSYNTTILGTTIFTSTEYVPPVYLLSISSSSIDGIPFILRGGVIGEMSYVTPWSGSLEEGPYKVEMPSNVIVGSDTCNFAQWEDGSTNPIRAVSLTSDLALFATYQLQVITAIEAHAFMDSVEVNAEGIIVETGEEFITPATVEVLPGSYTVRLTYEGKIVEFGPDEVVVAEGETVRIDGQFAPPKPEGLPLWVKILGPMSAAAVIYAATRRKK